MMILKKGYFKKILVSCSLMGLPYLAYADHKDFVSLTTAEYPPYFSEALPSGGVITDLVRAAFAESKMDLSISWFNFSQAISHAQKASYYDGIFTVWYTQERKKWAYFSDPILPNVTGIYAHIDTELPAYWNMKWLKASEMKIGLVEGYLNPQEVESVSLSAQYARTDQENIANLIRKKVDLIVIDKMVGEYLIDKVFSGYQPHLVWLDPPLEYRMQYLAIAKNAPNAKEKIDAFNVGLQRLRENGKFQKILKKHNFDWLLGSQFNWLEQAKP